MVETAKERAEKHIQYLEEKCNLPPEVPDNLRPVAFKQKIEEILVEMEEAYKNLQEKK